MTKKETPEEEMLRHLTQMHKEILTKLWFGTSNRPEQGQPEANKMRHVEKALLKLSTSELGNLGFDPAFISIENAEDVKGVAPIVKFTIQSDPISEVGVNGCQALDMLKYTKCLFESLNDAFPCRENSLTITKIEEAIHWQEARTRDRQKRGVEGINAK